MNGLGLFLIVCLPSVMFLTIGYSFGEHKAQKRHQAKHSMPYDWEF